MSANIFDELPVTEEAPQSSSFGSDSSSMEAKQVSRKAASSDPRYIPVEEKIDVVEDECCVGGLIEALADLDLAVGRIERKIELLTKCVKEFMETEAELFLKDVAKPAQKKGTPGRPVRKEPTLDISRVKAKGKIKKAVVKAKKAADKKANNTKSKKKSKVKKKAKRS